MMLAASNPKSETKVGNPSIDPSIIPVMVVTKENAAAARTVVSVVDSSAPADAAMKVDERDPIEPDSNEGTEGVKITDHN